MAEEEMYQEASDALQKGEKKRARDLLTRLIKINPDRVDYWIWMSSVVDSPRERIYCLQEALKLDPKNATAKNGLVIMGAMSPDESLMPPPGMMIRRKWQTAATDQPTGGPLQRRLRSKLTLRQLALPAGVVVVVIVLMVLVIYGLRRPTAVSYQPVRMTARPSATLMPTSSLVVLSPTPTFTGPTPLWMQMQVTYTPTPLYVPTPRSVLEAARTGMTAFIRGDYAKAITFLGQVATTEPTNVDALYYLAESYRLQGDYPKAITNYNLAIQVQPSFAPAYLGRARALAASNPGTDVAPDLQTAVANDPNFGEIYLEEARVALLQKDYEEALGFLKTAGQIMPGSPMVFLYQAQAYLGLDQPQDALSAAKKANQLDFTLITSYFVLGEALQANGQMAESIQPLRVYLTYAPRDTRALVLLGYAYTALQDWQRAEDAFDQAINLDANQIDAYLGRGEMFLANGDGKSASADFNAALKRSAKSFYAKIGLGRAALLQGLNQDAYSFFVQAESLAVSDADHAVLYYWRATALQALGRSSAAAKDWQALLDLPVSAVPTDWAAAARLALAATSTPTPTLTTTLTATRTLTPTRTPTRSQTPRVSSTPTH
jgi:tetratricopeptide (TPR) repeat protein